MLAAFKRALATNERQSKDHALPFYFWLLEVYEQGQAEVGCFEVVDALGQVFVEKHSTHFSSIRRRSSMTRSAT